MLPRKHRLRKNEDFQKIFRGGRSMQSESVLLRARKNTLPETRIGFIVGLKIAKKASGRNAQKRRLRAGAARYIKNIRKGLDIVFVARPGIEQVKYQALCEEMGNLLKRCGLL